MTLNPKKNIKNKMSSYIHFDLKDGSKISVLPSNPFFLEKGIGRELTNGGNLPFSYDDMLCLFYGVFPKENTFQWVVQHLENMEMLSLLYHEKNCYLKLFEMARDDNNCYRSKVFQTIKFKIFENISLHDLQKLYNEHRNKNGLFSEYLKYCLESMNVEQYLEYIHFNNGTGEILSANLYIPEKLGYGNILHNNPELFAIYFPSQFNMENRLLIIQKSMIAEFLLFANYELVHYIIDNYHIPYEYIQNILLHTDKFHSKKWSAQYYVDHIKFAIFKEDFDLCKKWIFDMSRYYDSSELQGIINFECISVNVFLQYYPVFSSDDPPKNWYKKLCVDRLITFKRFMHAEKNGLHNNLSGMYYNMKDGYCFIKGEYRRDVKVSGSDIEASKILVEKFRTSGVLDFFRENRFDVVLLKDHKIDSDSEESDGECCGSWFG